MWHRKFVGTVPKSVAHRSLNTRLFICFSLLSPAFHEYIQINLWQEGINFKSLLQNISKQGFNLHLILIRHLMPFQLEHTDLQMLDQRLAFNSLMFAMDGLGSICRWLIIHRNQMGDTCKWQLNSRKTAPSFSFQWKEEPNFGVIRNPVSTSHLALTFPH